MGGGVDLLQRLARQPEPDRGTAAGGADLLEGGGLDQGVLDASRSYSPQGTAITEYLCDLNGDGRGDVPGRTITHDFRDDRSHVVTLFVKDATGSVAIATASVQAAGSSTVSAPAKSTSRQKRSTVIRKGLRVRGTAKGRVKVTIRVDSSTRTKLKLKSARLATKTLTSKTNVPLSSKVRRTVGRQRSVKVTVVLFGAAQGTRTATIKR